MGEFCINCGAHLTEQEGFNPELSSYKCTACGFVNGEAETAAPVEVSENKKAERQQKMDNAIEKAEEKTQSFMKKNWKKVAIAVIVLAAILAVVLSVTAGLDAIKKIQKTGIASADCIGINYEIVQKEFEEKGFTDITCVGLEDLDLDNLGNEGVVDSVSIKDKTSFGKSKRVRSDAPVTISYHSAKMLNVPMASKKVKDKSCRTLAAEFENAGFTDIETKALYGTWGKEGRVLSVTVDGKKSWNSDDTFRIDSKVIIKYRTRKK